MTVAIVSHRYFRSTPAGQVAVQIAGQLAEQASTDGDNTESSGGKPAGEEIKIDDRIGGQMAERGWTEDGIKELTKSDPAGTTTDNTNGQFSSVIGC